MNPVTHQTIKLSKGRHSSPDDGACVMELASMLAGEAFSDHPKSACPVISSFLRTYNDSVDDERRQALYRYAALVVGTRASRDIARSRADYLGSILAELRLRRHPWARIVPESVREFLRPTTDMVPARAARTVARCETRMDLSVGETIDGLLAIGTDPRSGVARDGAVVNRPAASAPASEPERVRGPG
jgi:hypothetical protein